MKLIPTLIIAATFSTLAIAQEVQQLPSEHAVKIARKVGEAAGTFSDAPFAVEPDAEKAAGVKAPGDAGLLAIPDKKITADALAGASGKVLPLGQLWMRNVVPSVNNASADPAKLRTVTVRDGDNEAKVEVYFLGITKTEAGALELGLYTKESQPLVKAPLVKTDAAASSTVIALDGHKEGENTGVLVVSVFGSHKADVLVTKPRE